MRNKLAVFKKETLTFFVSPAAYVMLSGFLFLALFFFFIYLASYNKTLHHYASIQFRMGDFSKLNLNQQVIEVYFHTLIMVFMFIAPLMTMRAIVDERRQGTFELLFTSPLSVADIVWGKFLALAFIAMLMCTLAGILPFGLWLVGDPEGAPLISGFIGVALSALGFLAVGMGCSALAENQIVAGISSVMILLFLYLAYILGGAAGGYLQPVLESISPAWQVMDLIRGVISLRAVVYFLSLIGAGLFVCQRALDAER